MNLFMCGSKKVYHLMPPVIKELELLGHIVTTPNAFDDPSIEDRLREHPEQHTKFKAEMFALQEQKVAANDAVIIMNYDKDDQKNYIGGSTFLEMYAAFRQGKPIYLMNPVPENMLKDEIEGMSPVVLNGDVRKIK